MSGAINNVGSVAASVIWIDEADNTIDTIDLATGAATLVGDSGQALTDLAFSPNQNLYGESFTALYRIDTATGLASVIGNFGSGIALDGMVFSSTGTLYASGGTGLYMLNTATGAATLIGLSGLSGGFVSAGDLAFLNGALYETVTNGAVTDLARINPVTGAGTLIGQIVADPDMFGLVSSHGTLYGLDGVSIFMIDPGTAAATPLTAYPASAFNQAQGAAMQADSVPPNAAQTSTNPAPSPTPTPAPMNFQVQDQTTGQVTFAAGTQYSGPVPYLSSQFILPTADQVSLTAKVPNVFVQIGMQGQANPSIGSINVSVAGGNNVLASYANSTFLIDGSGTDQNYIDARALTRNSWDTIVNFHSGDNVTIWGLTPQDFSLNWFGDTFGAPGATGLTGVYVSPKPGAIIIGVTLAGFTMQDIAAGKVAVTYASISGTPYASLHAV